ncbi:MAG TPA: hypothetical protein VGL63_17330 [Streptosporangiaceae bacterium]|jgi:hypothetical protein
MSDIEERLADSMSASYDAARALPLRPLTLTPPRPRRWVLLFAPVAAALAVVAVVTGLNVLTGRAVAPRPSTGSVVPGQSLTGGVPRYYVDLNYNGQDVVRSVATGAVTATVPVRFGNQGGTAAGTSVGGAFYIAGFQGNDEKIYRFKLTSAGKVSGLATVKGSGALGGQIDAMAVSPDGTKLAVAVDQGALTADSLTVISLPSGVRRSWQGGLTMRSYETFTITSLSWMPGSQKLVFSALWCSGFHSGRQVCQGSVHSVVRQLTEVRSLDLSGGGSGLGHSSVLLGQSAHAPFIAAASITPDGSTITAVVLSGPAKYSSPGTVPDHLAVRQFATTTGNLVRTLYQRATGPTAGWLLSPDASGQHFLLSGAAVYNGGDGPPALQDKGFNGRISNGTLINLPPSSGELYGQAW